MREVLWKPDPEFMERTNIRHFMRYVQERTGRAFEDYPSLYRWSVDQPEEFWGACWDYFGVIASKPYDRVLVRGEEMTDAKWFTGAKLNYAENLLRFRDSDAPAILFENELGARGELSFRQLYDRAARMAKALRALGVGRGDVVAAYMPNIVETVIAMLAAVSLGAVWCSCATDIGASTAIDKFGQLGPKVLFTVDGYPYKGKVHDVCERAAEVAGAIGAEHVIVTHYCGDAGRIREIPHAMDWAALLAEQDAADFRFEQVDSDAPLFIMFSSGTTGKPKCMMHSHAGVLINQMKELVLQNDVRPGDRVLYITTCSWMMWNWQLSTLALGATLVIYDGNVAYPDYSTIWKIAERERVSLFGLSASYVHLMMKEGFEPRKAADLSALRCISQTGSALSEDGFRFIYNSIKRDLHFSSISGGTDINGSFISGNPLMPVRVGELQMPALGMCVACFDEEGNSVWDQQGELVCLKPVPTMPLRFVNDPDGKKYRDAYFDRYPGVWRHGDYVMFHSDTLGVSFYGRSDAVLKPSGVRIGTSEIYNVVNRIDGIADSLAVGQLYHGDQRIVLFVKLQLGRALDDALRDAIRTELRTKASPRHVPAVILQCPDYPRTQNGKKVEGVVSNLINGRKVTNRNALENPEILDYFEGVLPQLNS